MDKNFQDVSDYIIDMILRVGLEPEEIDRFIEIKLKEVVPKFTNNIEFANAKKSIRKTVDDDWKVKDHYKNIDIIKKLQFGSKEYEDFYRNRYE